MEKINIVFILGSLEIGGTERQFLEFVHRLDRSRFEPRVLAFHCHGEVRDQVEALNIPFTCLNFFGLQGRYSPSSYFQLYRLLQRIVRYLKQERPQIVQTYLFWTNVYGCIAAKIAGVPVRITGLRASMEEKYVHFPGRWLQSLSHCWATLIISNSRDVKNECLQRDTWVSDEKIQVIYNGIDLQRYVPERSCTLSKHSLGLADDAPLIGIVASLIPRKRHEDFLRAAARVQTVFPDAVFLIAGRDGGQRGGLENLARELGLGQSVRFLGERSDIPEIMKTLDVLVSTSSIEGLSNAIIEAMAMRTPVVATNIAGTSELVVDGETGLLVPLGDISRLSEAILRVLNDHALRVNMGNAGRQRVEALFQMDRMVRQTEAVYERLTSRQ